MRRVLHKVGAGVFRDRVLLQWAQDGSNAWAKLYAEAERWRRPAMPVSGEDLLARGVTEGPAIGEALRKLEAAWIESDFALGRDALLSKLS
jgi:poly(A) polymerase